MRCRLLVATLLPAITQACVRTSVGAFWQKGQDYHLHMIVRDRPGGSLQKPELIPAVGDSATLGLRADSVVRDTVFGSVLADGRQLPKMFREQGTTHFIGTRKREEWKVIFNPAAPKNGIGLIGQLSHRELRGSWSSGVPEDQGGGDFTLIPAT